MKRPDITTPNELFEASARYKAPVFQRPYVWGRKELEGLGDDIDTVDPEIGQFLGAIVLKDLGRPSGPSSPTEYLIIDGQQRLTTIYLVLLAIAEVAAGHDQKEIAQFIYQNYLAEVKSPQFRGWPKLVPTLQDRHSFWDILLNSAPEADWEFTADPEEKRPREARKIRGQWKRILSYVNNAVLDKEGILVKGAFDALLLAIQEQLKFIVIVLEENDDANAIFSRLNAEGIPLELADLIRNEVFSKFGASEGRKADRFYTKAWQPFEKSFSEGTLSAFFPIYAYIVFKGKVTKAAAFGELQKRWNSFSPHEILSDLQKYAPYYRSLSQSGSLAQLSDDLGGQLDRLSRMPRSRVTWPFIIEVTRAAAENRMKEKDAVRSLRIVESFLVRRALIGREPTGLHAVFKSLWDRTKGGPKDVLSKIVTRTIQTPDDSDLREVLGNARSDTRVILKFVLEELERAYVKANKYDPPPEIAGTIEHIMPQHLTVEWQRTVSPKDHEELVGLLGNLAPLSESQNKGLRDQPWEEKRKRFKGSNFKITQALAKEPVWDAQKIRTRTQEMVDWIVSEWPELDSI